MTRPETPAQNKELEYIVPKNRFLRPCTRHVFPLFYPGDHLLTDPLDVTILALPTIVSQFGGGNKYTWVRRHAHPFPLKSRTIEPRGGGK